MTPSSGRVLTGHAHRGCYARALHDCSSKLSREHYISRALLEYLDDHDALELRGLPWQTPETPRITAKTLHSKMLCERHNRALSPLDAGALKFFRALFEQPVSVRVDGHEVERALLKMLIGLLFAGCVRRTDGAAPTPNPGSPWIKLLFAGTSIPAPGGLYFLQQVGEQVVFPTKPRFGFAPLFLGDAVAGLTVDFSGFRFSLALLPAQPGDRHLRAAAYRPNRIATSHPDEHEHVIEFAW